MSTSGILSNVGLGGVKSLKDLIRTIRSCKTAAEERAIIAKESANIRSVFRENNSSARYKSVAKLLYIHLLGYPTQFGQMECLKLAASNKFSDKRLGYLGIMMLFDEHQETLTLITNSLKNDMNHPNAYVVGLALCALGNICSAEMAKDLCTEVEKHFSNANTYIKKKAILCSIKLVHKVPELQEHFSDKIKHLITTERHHGVLLSAIRLMTEFCKLNEHLRIEYAGTSQNDDLVIVSSICRILSTLSSSSGDPNAEYDVSGVSNPFLQVSILRLLRLLGHNNHRASDAMSDTLTQLGSILDMSKSAGTAVLYELVLTVIDIEADPTLQTMIINILGKFLENKDTNMRYVALNTLSRIVHVDQSSVQKHRNVILECIHDPDISIRRRALELAFGIINDTNIESICKDLLEYMELMSDQLELIPYMANNIASVADLYAPSSKWFVDTMLSVFTIAQSDVKDEAITGFLRFVSQSSSELQTYATFQLWNSLQSKRFTIKMDALIQSAAWCIGEYGQCIRISGTFEGTNFPSVSEKQLVDQLGKLLLNSKTSQSTKCYLVTSIAKLTRRFPNSVDELESILRDASRFADMESSQRISEYLYFIQHREQESIASLFDRIPPPPIPTTHRQGNKRSSAISANSTINLLSELDLMGTITQESKQVVEQTLATESHQSPSLLTLKSYGEYFAYERNGLELYFHRFIDPSNPTCIAIRAIFKNENQDHSINNVLLQVAVPKVSNIYSMIYIDNCYSL